MGRAKAPEFEPMVNMVKLNEELKNRGITVRDVAKILHRESVGNVRSILKGDIALKVGDLTRILAATGIKLETIVDPKYISLI